MENMKEAKLNNKKNKAPLIVLIIGIITLIAGVVVLLVNLLAKPGIRDAEYMVEVGTWAREDEPSVEWTFTEVGKGKLTTDAHVNDYDFIWAIEGENLKVESDWLYTLDDEYAYKLDQNAKTLKLTSGEETITFVPAVKTVEE